MPAGQGLLLAERIARVSGGTLVLPPEVSGTPPSEPSQLPTRSWQERVEEARTRRERSLPPAAEAQAVRAAEGAEVPVSGLERPGLFQGAPAAESDLLLITGPGCAGPEPWILEQVAQRAAHYPPAPVLILRAGAPALAR